MNLGAVSMMSTMTTMSTVKRMQDNALRHSLDNSRRAEEKRKKEKEENK